MAFDREVALTPVAIGDLEVYLFDPDPTDTESQRAIVRVQIKMSDGTIRERHYNLVDHVAAATIQQLRSFVASLRTKANSEILPTP